ncbi:MAG: DUF4091 domain-containing protein [Bacteroides sp.]|nr:DUF4091 domain-containing protein [Bacteroides sp.]MCM1378830.1 DUF4091 domain-containing protein [Bacteroides sp.]MCM1445447.1 DUF4091 domain-containing protein [Prevotella sp.]
MKRLIAYLLLLMVLIANASAEITFAWASKDVQYTPETLPRAFSQADTTVSAWRGERIGFQAIVASIEGADSLSVSLGSWTDSRGRVAMPASVGSAAWTRSVITDENRSCGDRAEMPTHRVFDIIDTVGSLVDIEKYGVCPIWCVVEVPRDVAPGTYFSQLTLKRGGEQIAALNVALDVNERVLPEVADWKFYLDFWQQPYSVSRYYGLERWSDAHFDALRPYMQALARAGQKVVTAILFYEPWGRQSYDKFDPMVETVLTADGQWTFNYDVFDKWVEFMDECGINGRINCFSMIPWDMSFRYFDEATNAYKCLNITTSSEEYQALWSAYLADFAAHLKEKGWFEKTAISMDERGLAAMRDAIAIANSAAPGLKIALAGNYHPEISADLDDYSIAYSQSFPADELARRKQAGQISTSYVCCADPGANIFTNNAPSDAAYLPIQAVAAGLDGILHWSWLNWNENPLEDSRLKLPGVDAYTFAPGDTYCYYPGPRTSVRFERLIEGIQQTEKIRLLREQWTTENNTSKIQELEQALQPFKSGKTDGVNSTAALVNNLERLLNRHYGI